MTCNNIMTPGKASVSSRLSSPPDVEVPIRVQYFETDRMGVVHHANYLRYFEVARMEQFRCWGSPYEEIEDSGCFLMITDMRCQCRAPAHFGGLIRVRTRVTRMTPYRIFHEYEVLAEDGKLLARGNTVLASVDDNGYPMNLEHGMLGGVASDNPRSRN